MERSIVHHDGLFFEWSPASKGPLTCAMTREEFEERAKRLDHPEDYKRLAASLEQAARSSETLDPEVLAGVIEARDIFGLPPLPDRK